LVIMNEINGLLGCKSLYVITRTSADDISCDRLMA
jgi:hypothetical protein